jgi:hypothetical protein
VQPPVGLEVAALLLDEKLGEVDAVTRLVDGQFIRLVCFGIDRLDYMDTATDVIGSSVKARLTTIWPSGMDRSGDRSRATRTVTSNGRPMSPSMPTASATMMVR